MTENNKKRYYKSMIYSLTYGYRNPCEHFHTTMSGAYLCCGKRSSYHSVVEVEKTEDGFSVVGSSETFINGDSK